MQLRFWIAEKFRLFPWDERLLALTVDHEEEAIEWFDMRAKWDEQAREDAKRRRR